jgi:hypothetical protein
LTGLTAGDDLRFLFFPLLLFGLLPLVLGRERSQSSKCDATIRTALGISPGLARYIITGGSDGTTLAAVLAQLTATGVISMQARSGSYGLELVEESASVQPEEAAPVRKRDEKFLSNLPVFANFCCA